MSLPETNPIENTGGPKRDSGGRFVGKGKTGAGSVSLEEQLEDAQNAFVLASDTIEALQAEKRTLTNTIEESRKICQERGKQLTEEKRLHRLSKMSDANARGILEQIRDYLGGDRDESALPKVERLYFECIDRGTACEVAIGERNDAMGQRDTARRERNEVVAKSQGLEAELAEAIGERDLARQDLEKVVRSSEEVIKAAQEYASITRVQFACAGLIIAVSAAAIAFFVGRWAR